MNFGPDTFVMRMVGSSMAPRFQDGDYVIVDPDESAADGGFVGVHERENGERTVRQYVVSDGRRMLRALADGWPERIVDEGNEKMILGVVVFVGEAL